MEKVLITGVAGGIGRLLARRLLENYEVCGVDRVPWEGRPRSIAVHAVDLRKRGFEDVIRSELPSAVVHMGFVRDFKSDVGRRHDANVRGTKRLLDHCAHYGVQKLIVVSSGTVYGALYDSPFYMDEDRALEASRAYPEIRDLVEVDALATSFLWRFPHIRTCVLRPVNVLGHYVRSMISEYLRLERAPTVLGFDPLMQFIHEQDVVEAIAVALEHGLQGVFNVVGPGQVPLHTAIREAGGRARSAAGVPDAPADPPALRARHRALAGGRDRLPQVPGHALGAPLRRGDELPAAVRAGRDLPEPRES